MELFFFFFFVFYFGFRLEFNFKIHWIELQDEKKKKILFLIFNFSEFGQNVTLIDIKHKILKPSSTFTIYLFLSGKKINIF